jgi:hypothetical protein
MLLRCLASWAAAMSSKEESYKEGESFAASQTRKRHHLFQLFWSDVQPLWAVEHQINPFCP